jgi:hypothetical protein
VTGPEQTEAAVGSQAVPAVRTGDPVMDAALQELDAAPADDLDAQIAAGERVHRALQSRLSDLGRE